MTNRFHQASQGLFSLALASRGLTPTRFDDDFLESANPIEGRAEWVRLTVAAALLLAFVAMFPSAPGA